MGAVTRGRRGIGAVVSSFFKFGVEATGAPSTLTELPRAAVANLSGLPDHQLVTAALEDMPFIHSTNTKESALWPRRLVSGSRDINKTALDLQKTENDKAMWSTVEVKGQSLAGELRNGIQLKVS